MRFEDAFLEELAARSDILDVVSSYVRMTKRGTSYIGLCPFHNEKTPSFTIAPDKQLFHCFGCGAGGGIYQFIMRVKNLGFQESVFFLAQRAGLKPPEQANDSGRKTRDRIAEANREAARFFHDSLKGERGGIGREYITRRGLSQGIVRRFGLGFAPDEWDGLIKVLTAKGFEKSELLTAGLAVSGKKGSVYDRFRNRLMFPIINLRGQVIAFGGRVLDDSTPKYLNSPETALFNKSHNLFALNFARKTKMDSLILAEGYMDVIALHQAGFDSAVASLGTSLTAQQAKLISRYGKRVIIAYDADSAGKAAANRAIEILGNTELEVKVLAIPGAKDPDEFIHINGREAFANLLERSSDHSEFRLASIEAMYNLRNPEDRVKYISDAAVYLATLRGAPAREVYAGRVAEAAGVSREAVLLETQNAGKRLRKSEDARKKRKELSPVSALQPLDREKRYKNPTSAAAEEGILAIISSDPVWISHISGKISSEDFTSPDLARIYTAAIELAETNGEISLAALSSRLGAEDLALLTKIIQTREYRTNTEKAAFELIDVIHAAKLKPESDEDLLKLAGWKRSHMTNKGYGGS